MTRIVRNHNFEPEVNADPEFAAQMAATTTHVAVEADKAAPDVTGYYKRRIAAHSQVDASAIDAEGSKDLKVLPRGGDNVVLDTDPFAHLVEGGSVNNPPYAPLRRGARAAGLRIAPDPS